MITKPQAIESVLNMCGCAAVRLERDAEQAAREASLLFTDDVRWLVKTTAIVATEMAMVILCKPDKAELIAALMEVTGEDVNAHRVALAQEGAR